MEHGPQTAMAGAGSRMEDLDSGYFGVGCPGGEISGLLWITPWPVQCLLSFPKRMQSLLRMRDPGDGCGVWCWGILGWNDWLLPSYKMHC